MKNSQKGFIVPVLLVIIALLVIGGGVYVYENKKTETSPVVDTKPQQTNQVQPTNTQTTPVVTNQTILNSLVADWKKIGPNILPGFPAVSQAFYGYPDIIQFIGNNRIVISYQDDFNPLFAVLSYDTNKKQFSYLDGLRSSPFKVSETLWNTWRKKYGDNSFAPQTYQFSSTRTGDVVYSSDWKLITKNPFVSSNSSVNVSSTLLIIEATGGLCQYGGCFSKTTIKKDGTFTTEDGGSKTKSGSLGVNAVKNLQNLIESSNYSALRSTPFTEMCPTAYDGSELTYKFQTSHGEEIIDSCQTKIDSSSSLFKETQNILNTIYSYN